MGMHAIGWSLLLACLQQSPEPEFARGQEAFTQGKYGEAETAFRKVLERDQRHAAARLFLAKTSLHLTKEKDAETHLTALLKDDPEHVEAVALLGALLYKQTRWKEALPLYRKIVKGKEQPLRRAELARVHYELRDFNAAREIFVETYADPTARPMSAEYLGLIALSRDGGAEAEKYLREVHETDPKRRDIHPLLARALFRQGKTIGPIAVRRFGTEIPAAGTLLDDGVVLGPAPSASGDALFAGTLSAIFHALRAPPSTEMSVIIAHGWLDIDNRELAAKAFNAIPAADRAGRDIALLSLRLSRSSGDHKSVEETARKALAAGTLSSSEVAAALTDSALALRASGTLDRARALLLEAERINPVSETILLALAELEEAMKNPAAAKARVERLLELYPDHRMAPRWERKLVELAKQGEGK